MKRNELDRLRIEADTADFLKRGGAVRKIPTGLSGEKNPWLSPELNRSQKRGAAVTKAKLEGVVLGPRS